MPSGAKKRKAAKKKKGNQANNPSATTHPHGDENVKHNDDIESDVGENSSPKSQDHQNIVIEEEERKLQNLTSEEGLRIDSGGKHIDVEESIAQIEREFKTENELDRKHESIERGSSRSSSSSSSSSYDDESRGIKNRQAESHVLVGSAKVPDTFSVESFEAICNPPRAEAGDSVVRIIPTVDSEKITVLSEQVKMNVHSASDVSSAFKENGEEKLSSIEDNVSASMASVDAALERKEEVIVLSDANTGTTSDSKECVTQENGDRSRLPYNNAPRAGADNGEEQVKENVVTQPVLAPPFPVEKTSWKGCCGLFEVFSQSSA